MNIAGLFSDLNLAQHRYELSIPLLALALGCGAHGSSAKVDLLKVPRTQVLQSRCQARPDVAGLKETQVQALHVQYAFGAPYTMLNGRLERNGRFSGKIDWMPNGPGEGGTIDATWCLNESDVQVLFTHADQQPNKAAEDAATTTDVKRCSAQDVMHKSAHYVPALELNNGTRTMLNDKCQLVREATDVAEKLGKKIFENLHAPQNCKPAAPCLVTWHRWTAVRTHEPSIAEHSVTLTSDGDFQCFTSTAVIEGRIDAAEAKKVLRWLLDEKNRVTPAPTWPTDQIEYRDERELITVKGSDQHRWTGNDLELRKVEARFTAFIKSNLPQACHIENAGPTEEKAHSEWGR